MKVTLCDFISSPQLAAIHVISENAVETTPAHNAPTATPTLNRWLTEITELQFKDLSGLDFAGLISESES